MLQGNNLIESLCDLVSIVVDGSVGISEYVVRLLLSSSLGSNLTLLCVHSPAALAFGTGRIAMHDLWRGTFISHPHSTKARYAVRLHFACSHSLVVYGWFKLDLYDAIYLSEAIINYCCAPRASWTYKMCAPTLDHEMIKADLLQS